MTAVAETPANTPADGGWDSLLSLATLEDATERKRRATVDVPPAVLELVKNARENRKRITLPYDAVKFEQLQDVFYSAGDLLEPKCSVTVSRVRLEGEKATVVKDHTATHVRIFVGERRGNRKKATDKTANAASKSPETVDKADDAPADKSDA